MDIDDRPLDSLGRRQAKPVALAIRRKPAILARLAAGEPLTQIAPSIGYADHRGICERLANDSDYQAAMRAGAIAKLERREGELEAAPDNVAVSRARELLSHARWRAERLDPDRWGQRQIGGNAGPTVVLQLGYGAPQQVRVIEGEKGEARAIGVMSSTSAPEQCDTDKNDS